MVAATRASSSGRTSSRSAPLLGPRVMLDDERCILCSRCVRFCKEIAHDDVLGFVDRGSYSTLTCYPGPAAREQLLAQHRRHLPGGALTSTDFRFKMRVWFLKTDDQHRHRVIVGANTVVWSREGVIYRITPRRNDEVNDTWMADSGRMLYKAVRATTASRAPRSAARWRRPPRRWPRPARCSGRAAPRSSAPAGARSRNSS